MDLIATLKCADKAGIVHAMTTAVLKCDGNIIENQQFTDTLTNTFVMRTRFESASTLEEAIAKFNTELKSFDPILNIRPTAKKLKALVMVTKESHCLRDLIYLLEMNELPIEIPLVISNHEELGDLVSSLGIAFQKVLVNSNDKFKYEEILLNKIKELKIDFIVLARYMQILSPQFCNQLAGRIINIHHSFLPGFKGSKPYHQAHNRGVKIIGATAHFVTPDLDEGPIIEQDVVHVSHSARSEDLIAMGRDVERRVLARAVKLFAEDRIFIVGKRTIIFT